jgi:SAM-dependent methyltransferase
MKETGKASVRRSRDPSFLLDYFVGEGLDIAPGSDSLGNYARFFPRMTGIINRTPAQGPLHKMDGLPEARFDFIHSSHGLADVDNPHQALARWLDLLKPGGHAIITVPDEDLHGKGKWPNPFNRNHKASFTICKSEPGLPHSVNVLELVQAMAPVARCERITLVRDHFDSGREQADQTASGPAECAIEIVLRKRAVPTAQDLLGVATQARNAKDSIEACRELRRVYPYRFDVYHRSMVELMRWDAITEIDTLVEECIRRLPNEHNAHLYQILHAITRGDLQKGFALREVFMKRMGWRRRTTAEPPKNIAEWKGQPLAGKSIAIWSEFGLGDEIFFMRFARIIREQCGASRVVLMCQAPLVELYEASGEADEVIGVDRAAQLPNVDYWVYPHAIPAHLPLKLEALPKTVPYLRAPAKVVSKLPPVGANKLKVGLVFKGNPTHENDKARSLPSLSVLDDLFKFDGIEFFSLQKGAGADEAAAYADRHAHFHDVGPALNTMAETASAIADLDLVITVDTSVAHVAGAMDKPVWLILPFFGDWRWHYTREDSPWYPSMRLFRQRFGCDRSEVIARVAGHLLRLKTEKAESTLSKVASAMPALSQ